MSQFFKGVTDGNLPPDVATTYPLNVGTAVPGGNVLYVLGVGSGNNGIKTSATTTVNPNDTILITLLADAPNYVNITTASSPYTVLSSDYYISCDATAGPITILFPNAPTTGQYYVVKDRTGQSFANNITVTTVDGAVLIDGSTTYAINTNYESIELLFNGTSYEVF